MGIVNGRHMAQIARAVYTPWTKYPLWLMMELAIIASDIQEVIGSAIAINFLSNNVVPLWAGALITAVDTFTFLLLEAAGREGWGCGRQGVLGGNAWPWAGEAKTTIVR